MKKRKASEYQECRAYFEWAQYQPVLKDYLIHNPNEGKRSKIVGFFLKLIGLRPGIPDYQFPVANEKYIGLWIEMKIKGNKLTDNQVEWVDKLTKIGHYACVCYGADEAIKITMDYLNNKL